LRRVSDECRPGRANSFPGDDIIGRRDKQIALGVNDRRLNKCGCWYGRYRRTSVWGEISVEDQSGDGCVIVDFVVLADFPHPDIGVREIDQRLDPYRRHSTSPLYRDCELVSEWALVR
jgi:hypothetical protein